MKWHTFEKECVISFSHTFCVKNQMERSKVEKKPMEACEKLGTKLAFNNVRKIRYIQITT